MRKIVPFFLPAMRSMMFIAGGLVLSAATGLTLLESASWWGPLCILMNIITIAVLLIVCKSEKTRFMSLIAAKGEGLRLRPAVVITLLMSVLGVGCMIFISILFYKGPPEMLSQPLPVWVAVLNLILLPVTIVFAEMPLYFGYSFNRLKTLTGSPVFSIAYVIFFYALQHSFMPVIWDMKYILFRFLSFLPLMIVLGIIYSRKRLLPEMMIGHGVMDLGTGIQILISSLMA